MFLPSELKWNRKRGFILFVLAAVIVTAYIAATTSPYDPGPGPRSGHRFGSPQRRAWPAGKPRPTSPAPAPAPTQTPGHGVGAGTANATTPTAAKTTREPLFPAILSRITLAPDVRLLGKEHDLDSWEEDEEEDEALVGGEDPLWPPLDPEEETILLNVTDFHYLINNEYTCPPAPRRLLLLVLVHTAPGNREKRDAIRETWGMPVPDARVLFGLGAVEDPRVQRRLDAENVLFGDLVQGSFRDSYRNMTYKHVMALKWATSFCPTASYVLKVDDDGFVNMPALLRLLGGEMSPRGARNLLLCPVRKGVNVERSGSKWTVTKEEFANDKYPTMCLGVAILYSPDVVRRLYLEAQQTKYFWIDDAHVTGTLAKNTNTSHSALGSLLLMYPRMDKLPDPHTQTVLFIYELQPKSIHEAWQKLVSESMFDRPIAPTTPLSAVATTQLPMNTVTDVIVNATVKGTFATTTVRIPINAS